MKYKSRCMRCGHRWETEQKRAKVCPNCHTVYWHESPAKYDLGMLNESRRVIFEICLGNDSLDERTLIQKIKIAGPKLLPSHIVTSLDQLVDEKKLIRTYPDNSTVWPIITVYQDAVSGVESEAEVGE